jgi:hypothetical protein
MGMKEEIIYTPAEGVAKGNESLVHPWKYSEIIREEAALQRSFVSKGGTKA